MTGLLERLGIIIHWIGLFFFFLALSTPIIYLAGNLTRQDREDAAYFVFFAIIWWPIRWVLTGRTSIRPIAPQRFTND